MSDVLEVLVYLGVVSKIGVEPDGLVYPEERFRVPIETGQVAAAIVDRRRLNRHDEMGFFQDF